MYRRFYGFHEKPFSLLPDPAFLYPSRKHQMALNLLEMAICNQSGFCVISGEIGTGKTTLVRELLNRVDERVRVGLISNTHESFAELLGWILQAFDITSESDEAVYQHRQFTDFLVRQYAEGRHTLLIIDEAQNLSLPAMEQLRMLSNVNSDKDLVLQVILVGQRELQEKLRQPELVQFAQRITIDYHLVPLDEQETIAYIRHRVATAGVSDALFDEGACRLVYRCTDGVPRLINRLCDLALVYGYADQVREIGVDLIQAVAAEQKLLHGHAMLPGPAEPRVLQGESRKTLLTGPAAKAPLPAAGTAAQHASGCGSGSAGTDRAIKQTGANVMKQKQTGKPSTRSKPVTAVAPALPANTAAPRKEPVVADETATAETLRAAAERASLEKEQAQQVAAAKAAAASTAVEAAEAELASARAAAEEKRAAEQRAAEKIVAERKASRQAAASRSAAETAAAARQEAEQAVVRHDDDARRAAGQLAREQEASERALKEQMGKERSARDEAARATAAAAQALAERIAAEQAAAKVAAAAETAVQQALLERVAAEKAAAERLEAAEEAARKAGDALSAARRQAAERREAEQAALARSAQDVRTARAIAAEKIAASEAEKRLLARSAQAAEKARALRAAAEQAVAERRAASKAAAEKVTAEKVALARMAASEAAAAQLAAQQAEAAKLAALREASEKEAAAAEAARRAAAAEAAALAAADAQSGTDGEIVDIPEAVETRRTPHPLDQLLLAGAPTPALQQQVARARASGRRWAIMSLLVVAGGASLLAFKWPELERLQMPWMAGAGPADERASLAAMEVKDDLKEE